MRRAFAWNKPSTAISILFFNETTQAWVQEAFSRKRSATGERWGHLHSAHFYIRCASPSRLRTVMPCGLRGRGFSRKSRHIHCVTSSVRTVTVTVRWSVSIPLDRSDTSEPPTENLTNRMCPATFLKPAAFPAWCLSIAALELTSHHVSSARYGCRVLLGTVLYEMVSG